MFTKNQDPLSISAYEYENAEFVRLKNHPNLFDSWIINRKEIIANQLTKFNLNLLETEKLSVQPCDLKNELTFFINKPS